MDHVVETPIRAATPLAVAVVARAGSTVAAGIEAALLDRGIEVVPPGAGVPDVRRAPDVMLVVVEPGTEEEGLWRSLDGWPTPALVVASSRRLATQVLPLLGDDHDLATIAEPAEVIEFRLRRLVERARRPGVPSAFVDSLTGLMSRAGFESCLDGLRRSRRGDEVTGLLFVDLDGFKIVNDRLGHLAGDRVLRALGRHLAKAIAPPDVVARIGGDEFALLLTRPDVDGVVAAAEGVLQHIQRLDLPALRAHADFRVGASAGLTFVRPEAAFADLMHEADTAAYEVKCSGRGRLCRFDQLRAHVEQSGRDLQLQHFENSTRLATQRLVETITLKSRRLLDEARREANVCALTGLYNRRHLDAELAREIERARVQRVPLSLALIDLDHFHDVNEAHGWPTGDRVLQAFTTVARSSARASDWIARYGGEEFVIVMPGTDSASGTRVAERVRDAFSRTTVESVEGRSFRCTLSAGVVQLAPGAVRAADFLHEASKALLRAKADGRNRVA